ncbi:DNA-binding transcriptional regulator, LysR family [Kushneria avicenniae]|uniref:DNA-binding transcriptional regulator, LysR family n=1 Tax=Kushneria avicenniae TaxID=402385 RepID=A0A1I1JV26_9GAMM|nr:LysR substrate-binding domain-containing protein [Kushneria avicenniae]SFC52539.1 DNA-binding transcriptional regulator, LysR family [Kushneria avicenniae]
MFLRQLHYLVAVAEHRHFARAAEACRVSQPALSAGIRQLEEELKVTIVQRDRRFQGLTDEGLRVLKWARQTLNSLDGLRQEAALAQRISGGHLAIGAVPSALRAISTLAAEYRRVVPDLTLEILSLSTQEIARRLKERELHLALAYTEHGFQQGFETLGLYRETFVLLSGESCAIPPERHFQWHELGELPLCLFNKGMHNRHILDGCFQAAGVTPRVVVETNAPSIIHEEVRKGQIYAIAPASALPDYFMDGGVRLNPIADQPCATISLIRLSQDNPPAVASAIWDHTQTLDLLY